MKKMDNTIKEIIPVGNEVNPGTSTEGISTVPILKEGANTVSAKPKKRVRQKTEKKKPENLNVKTSEKDIIDLTTEEVSFAPILNEDTNIVSAKPTKHVRQKIEKKKPENLNVKTSDENKAALTNLKRKTPLHPPTSEMVMDSIKAIKKRKGASFEDIGKYMEENYEVNMKVLKSHVSKFLQKSVDNGVLEKFSGAASGADRFKVKKPEVKKSSRNLPLIDVSKNSVKNMVGPNRRVKK